MDIEKPDDVDIGQPIRWIKGGVIDQVIEKIEEVEKALSAMEQDPDLGYSGPEGVEIFLPGKALTSPIGPHTEGTGPGHWECGDCGHKPTMNETSAWLAGLPLHQCNVCHAEAVTWHVDPENIVAEPEDLTEGKWDELPSCPFCGAGDIYIVPSYADTGMSLCNCGSCGAAGSLCATEAEARASWSRRAVPPSCRSWARIFRDIYVLEGLKLIETAQTLDLPISVILSIDKGEASESTARDCALLLAARRQDSISGGK